MSPGRRPCCPSCGLPFSDWFIWGTKRYCYPCWAKSGNVRVIVEPNCSECWGQTYVPGHYEATGYELVCSTCFPEANGCPDIHSAQQWAQRHKVNSRSNECFEKLNWWERFCLQQWKDFERIRDGAMSLLRDSP